MVSKIVKGLMLLGTLAALGACGSYGARYHYNGAYYQESPPNYEEPRCDRLYDTRHCERYYERHPKG